MRYQSTRGGVQELTFEQALFTGFCSDGGLLMPSRIPSIDKLTLRKMAGMTYMELVKYISRLYIAEAEIPTQDLNGILDRALSRFSIPGVVKVARLSGGLNILELFHGPTLAFKDLALSCVGQLVSYFLDKRKKHVTIIVGTSGDTGSAAIESVAGLPWIDIVVLLPRGRCTRVQELQMTTVIEDNVHVIRVDGSSDDLDIPIKHCFQDVDFVKKHTLFSINSINWARVMVQIAHYFYAYFQMCRTVGEEVEIVVPTGAMGNSTGGCIAREMGLPIKLVCTVNVNDTVARTIQTGDLSVLDGGVKQTWASAMDIQMPYNVERFTFLYSGGNADLVKKHLEEFYNNLKTTIPASVTSKMQEAVSSHTVDDNKIIEKTMRRCWEENKYLLCPHTAIAATYHYRHPTNSLPRICIATASPAKFEEAVLSAGLTPQPTEGVKALDGKPTRYTDWEKSEDWLAALKAKIEEIHVKISAA